MNNHPKITVSVPGTCGELVQGWHPGWEKPVLVSCPIDLYSRITVSLRADARLTGPRGFDKLRRAARLALDYLNRPAAGATFAVNSQLSSGRGMASSTADVVGAMAGLAVALSQSLRPAELARLACQVEPTDSTMFNHLTMLAYRDDGHFEPIGPTPSLPLLMLDPGQVVDTLTFNRKLNLAVLRQLGPTTAEALALLQNGALNAEAEAIGAAASLSAASYQPILFNPLLAQAQHWATATGALGVVRAHSGSLIGLLYPPGTPLDEPARWLTPRFNGPITATRLTPGGYRLEPGQLTQQIVAELPLFATTAYQLEGMV